MPIIRVRAGGHTFGSVVNFTELELPKVKHVCGSCLTDDEIEQQLGPAVAFVIGILINRFAANDWGKELIPALETVRAFYIVRNNEGEGRFRAAAIRALGLANE